ncbi:MAG: sulfate transporter CysZ [Acidiferrobacterales bacterium]
MFSNFAAGSSYALKGFSYIGRPGLRRYFFIPIMLNVVIFGLASWYVLTQFTGWLDKILPEGGGWWLLVMVLAVLVGFVLLVAIFFAFTIVLNLIGAPFNGLLSEKVEAILNREPIKIQGGMKRFLSGFMRSIMGELRKYLYFAILALGVLIVSFIPGLNFFLAPILSFLFGGWMMALEYIAYPMENHDQYFPDVRRWARSNKMLCLGFGIMVLLMTITPILNLVVMPAAVAGATQMWNERREFYGTSGVA